jgi:REP element-mobilizing transposase RayT
LSAKISSEREGAIMARQLRIEYPGAVYHVTGRGNAQQGVFLGDDDRYFFLGLLAKVNKRFNWLCHAYCLMDNHYHLLIETPEGKLSKGMRQLGGVYTQSFNRRHNRVGHLFQGRFKSILIEKENYLLELCRYVVLNPVRARLVKAVEDWPWSSYRATVGLEVAHPCLSTDWTLGQFSLERDKAKTQYSRFVADGVGQDQVWNDLQGQVLLGQENFTEQFADVLKGYAHVAEIPRQQRSLDRPPLIDLFNDVVRGNKASRNAKIVEAVEVYGYAQSEVAAELGLHYSTISQVVSKKNQE